MRWIEVREAYPDQWVVIEGLETHAEGDRHVITDVAVIGACADGRAALASYRRLHRQHPQRLFYYVHTGRKELDVKERRWVGVRRGHAADVEG